MGYYFFKPGMSIKNVIDKWSNGDKAYDAEEKPFTIFGKTTTVRYHGVFDWEDIWKYREYNRPLNKKLGKSIIEEGLKEPIKIIVGKNENAVVGEGNHRIKIIKEISTKTGKDIKLPVEFIFYHEIDKPNARLDEYIDLLLEQYQTKSGEQISFVVKDDSEEHKNKHLAQDWKVTDINAYVNGKHVGYLKISYIPEDRFLNRYKNIFDYLSASHKGKSWYKNFYQKPLKERVKILLFHEAGMLMSLDEKIDNMSEEELKKIEKKYIDQVKEDYKKDFERFIDFHVNKPLVDYIRVFDDYRRNRIAIALYEYGAKWLAKQGMKLYASGLQSNEAEAAWKWLAKNKAANIGQEKSLSGKTRTYLSYL